MLFAKMHRIIYSKMMDFFWIPSNLVELKIVYEKFEMTINRTYTLKTLSLSHFKWLRISTFIFFLVAFFFLICFFSLSSAFSLSLPSIDMSLRSSHFQCNLKINSCKNALKLITHTKKCCIRLQIARATEIELKFTYWT